ncbi:MULTISPECIES: histidine kinase [unclassified Corynebacterium]|uniref:histidine kinase n=1 Tax=unclassified Corynebacterium TaxID=2624378 RepID=UPI0026525212|nr:MULTISPECIES: histidine kinase [unclassified Corynebacterium]MDN8594236.1 histidine kinase [Corynebacterium sp. P4_F2]WKK55214.1 histidine kinase [Corynebacterium sp. P4-C1]
MKTTSRILAFFRVSLHVLVAVLLAVGLFSIQDSRVPALTICLAAVFAGLYLAGTVLHHRGKEFPRTAGWAWLAVVGALWMALVWSSTTFAWLEFPLVMLACYLLPAPVGILVSLAAGAFTVFVMAPESDVAGIIGPTIGTLVAVVASFAYQALRAEAQHYRQLAARLEATQMELAESQYQAGALQERTRLAREVHDTMAQGLSSIVLFGRVAAGHLESGDPARKGKAQEILCTIVDTASENLAEARRFVAANSPEAAPLGERLEAVAASARSRQKAVDAPFDLTLVANSADQITGAAADVVERVVREGLSNIVRHSHADKAVVTVEKLGTVATVDVFDDGSGVKRPEGHGLTGLRARVAEVGGTLELESSPRGTVLAARIPLED